MEEPEAVLTPATPPARSVSELRNIYINRARRNNGVRAGHATAPFTASAKTLGAQWGVGVGLHFELLKWLRWLSLLLMICAIPFIVAVGCSIFTDAAHMDDHDFGVKKYPATKVHSMTFAAIVDDSIDNGTLQYMNTVIGQTWKGPMHKSTFLIWISLVDAGSLLLFMLGLAVLWYHLKRFAKSIDKDTLEAADYTVIVRGLPAEADAVQVGEHFSRYGEVMDVVLVTDRLSATLHCCGRAARLQQRRGMVLDASRVLNTGQYGNMLDKMDEQLAGIAGEIHEVAERTQCVKAAFVTFNSENERRACTSQCPNSWLGSLMQPRLHRFQRTRAFYVRRAAAPDDYKFEHLAVSEWQLAAREIAIDLMMLVLALLCAAAITKLTDISNQQSSSITWFNDKLSANAATAMMLYGNNSAAAADDNSAYLPLTSFCAAELRDYCTTQLYDEYDGMVRLEFGLGLQWVNTTSRLLFERSVREELVCSAKAARGGAECKLQGCLACLCLGLSMTTTSQGPDTGGAEALLVCPFYINQLDVRSWGIRLSISAVVAVLNSAIKWILAALVRHGRHWTHTARERSYALQCFIAMLINTVVVLLLTNCDSLGRMARNDAGGSWIRYFVRYGSYGDFTAGWYENVGLSILILMLINATGPLVNMLIDKMWQVTLRCYVRYCITWPLQADYDVAWAPPRFTLAQRTADLLLNAALALLFGTGMPLLYLVFVVYVTVAELADRWALTRRCCGAARYNTGLMKLVVGLLPWMAVAHCAFGLWMHTYFHVVVPPEGGGADEVSQFGAAAMRATNARLSSTSSDLSLLQQSSAWQRITQPNGLALLLVMVALALWLLIGRYFLWQLLSCLGRAGQRLCCAHATRLMRFRLYRDTELEVHATSYEEALKEGQLHGTPTYRLSHHPHYLQYFAASGLNSIVGVAELVVAAASGGARRQTYSRLKTIQRRGRLPGGPSSFRVLPEPVIETSSVPLRHSAASSTVASRQAMVSAVLEERRSGLARGDPEDSTYGADVVLDAPRPKPRKVVRGPDVLELLQGEEERSSSVQQQHSRGQQPRCDDRTVELALIAEGGREDEDDEREGSGGPESRVSAQTGGASAPAVAATAVCVVVASGREDVGALRIEVREEHELELGVPPVREGVLPTPSEATEVQQPQPELLVELDADRTDAASHTDGVLAGEPSGSLVLHVGPPGDEEGPLEHDSAPRQPMAGTGDVETGNEPASAEVGQSG